MMEHRGQLQPDQQENKTIQEKFQHPPDRSGSKSRSRGGHFRDAPAVIQPSRDYSQYSRDTELLGWQIRREGREQRKGNLNGRVVDPLLYPEGDITHEEADADSTNTHKQEMHPGMP